jgi:hypothetical protein
MLQEITVKAPLVVAYVIAHKDVIIPLIGGATGLSITSLTIVEKVSNNVVGESGSIKRKVVSYILVQGLTFLTAVAAFLFANVNIAHLYPWLATLVTGIHTLAVNPIYVKKVLPYLEFQAGQKATAQALTPTLDIPADVSAEAAAGSAVFAQ